LFPIQRELDVTWILGSEDSEALLLCHLLETGVALWILPGAVHHQVRRSAFAMEGIAGPGNHRAWGGSPLGKELLLPDRGPIPLNQSDLMAELPFHSRDDPIQTLPELGIELRLIPVHRMGSGR
jgi:hypothetical protein